MFSPGDKVRVKKVLGGINSDDWELMAYPQIIERANIVPLTGNPNHQSLAIKGYPYIISSDHVILVQTGE